MKPWKDLSMSERRDIIRLSVRNGVNDLNTIRDTYNNVYAEDEGDKKFIPLRNRQFETYEQSDATLTVVNRKPLKLVGFNPKNAVAGKGITKRGETILKPVIITHTITPEEKAKIDAGNEARKLADMPWNQKDVFLGGEAGDNPSAEANQNAYDNAWMWRNGKMDAWNRKFNEDLGDIGLGLAMTAANILPAGRAITGLWNGIRGLGTGLATAESTGAFLSDVAKSPIKIFGKILANPFKSMYRVGKNLAYDFTPTAGQNILQTAGSGLARTGLRAFNTVYNNPVTTSSFAFDTATNVIPEKSLSQKLIEKGTPKIYAYLTGNMFPLIGGYGVGKVIENKVINNSKVINFLDKALSNKYNKFFNANNELTNLVRPVYENIIYPIRGQAYTAAKGVYHPSFNYTKFNYFDPKVNHKISYKIMNHNLNGVYYPSTNDVYINPLSLKRLVGTDNSRLIKTTAHEFGHNDFNGQTGIDFIDKYGNKFGLKREFYDTMGIDISKSRPKYFTTERDVLDEGYADLQGMRALIASKYDLNSVDSFRNKISKMSSKNLMNIYKNISGYGLSRYAKIKNLSPEDKKQFINDLKYILKYGM